MTAIQKLIETFATNIVAAAREEARQEAIQETMALLASGSRGYEWDPLESTCRHASLSIL